MRVSKNKDVNQAVKELCQCLSGADKKKFMSVARELKERTQECERLRKPTLTQYAKELVWKKHLDQIKDKEETPYPELEIYTDPNRENCNQDL
tara:strand:- start:619 stop:897 length:279 start_codon:yes stop_codon:yes gene_type:complete